MVPEIDMQQVGKRLRQRRKALRATQEDIATATGIRIATLSNLERGAAPSAHLGTFYQLCRALDCSADWLLGLSTDDSPPAE